MLFNNLESKIINFPDYEIVASDIDKTALKIAKEGVYGEYSIHEIPRNYLETHFTRRETQLGPKFIINNEIKNKVEFIEEDIIRGHKKNTKYDVIFCRNLLIYINRESKEKLLRTLENHLMHGGLLILGKTEMLVNIKSNFKSIDSNNHFYVKSRLNKNIKIKQIVPIKPLKIDTKNQIESRKMILDQREL
jgi:chemotaxis methyl-accepting protein methylase